MKTWHFIVKLWWFPISHNNKTSFMLLYTYPLVLPNSIDPLKWKFCRPWHPFGADGWWLILEHPIHRCLQTKAITEHHFCGRSTRGVPQCLHLFSVYLIVSFFLMWTERGVKFCLACRYPMWNRHSHRIHSHLNYLAMFPHLYSGANN